MFVCVAGKNDISVEILEYLVECQEDRYEIGVVCNKNETGKDSWQKSLRYHAKKMGIREYALQEIYNMQQVLFLSLEFDQIIRPQKFADAIKQKIEKVSSKKISSYIASYHLSTLMKKLGWKSNKEYRTTNKTYGRDYYTEKARVELFKKIDEDYESIVRLSNAHFVE